MSTNHQVCAILFPEPYKGTVNHPSKEIGCISIVEAATRMELPPILMREGDWVVTTAGVDCLIIQYNIETSRLDERDWETHMSEKSWINIADFRVILGLAKRMKEVGYI
ncbi:MAG: hypothetical protein NTX50_08345 [Candidatus Sumerlaeota bacterium]|nr:hypothetical protein [Candidatus Sumerlaeota bacterium]